MDSEGLRKSFLEFFKQRGHTIVPSSSLLPLDPSVLFVSAGMQQFKKYFLGEPSPYGNKAASCQKCFRTSDIDEIGDISHLTFLEMLGNFSFGEYFKKEAIEWAYEFIVKGLGLKIDFVSVFAGDKEVPPDKESKKIWSDLGIPLTRIKKMSRKDNFWGPTGDEGPCGPTTEIYLNNIEVWNLVFNEYYQNREKKLIPLKQKGIDTGMGLERLAMIIQKKPSIFETDLFLPIVNEIEKKSAIKYNSKTRLFRIITDHIRGSVFLIAEGILPSNLERGYILRRILRRAIRYGKILGMSKNSLIPPAQKVIEIYQNVYPELKSNQADILTVIQKEEEKFEKTLERGLKEFKKLISKNKDLSKEEAFDLYQSYGFPLEFTQELAKEKGFKVDKKGFEEAIKKHQEISRAGAEKKFGGVGKETSYEATKLHTATHLLHQALREVLGKHVKQMGSDITSQRLRFDFPHPQKLSSSEIKKVEDVVNQKIKEDLEVKKQEMPFQKAIKSGALAFFKEKYPKEVTVYSIKDFSKEICAGPHVKRTSELGHFKIIKEESSGAGIRRIRAILE